MKKIANFSGVIIMVSDSMDYIILEKDNQLISDKYVDEMGNKINMRDNLKEGDLIIREFYYIYFSSDHYELVFTKFKHYELRSNEYFHPDDMKEKLRTEDSFFHPNSDFDDVKDNIISVFSNKMGITFF